MIHDGFGILESGRIGELRYPATDVTTEWIELLEKTELQGDSHHFLRIGNRDNWTHLRLNIFPDGGVSRMRIFGCPDWDAVP